MIDYAANPENEVTDTLADLMHICGEAEIDFWQCMEIARRHYFAETEFDGNETKFMKLDVEIDGTRCLSKF